jgi:hypothetical protein
VLEVSGVMRSTDGGESWNDCSADLLRLAEAEPRLRSKLVSDTEAEGMLDGHAVCTSSADPDGIIIAVRMGLFHSKDQGKTWQDMRVDRFSPFTYDATSAGSEHALCLSQRRSVIERRRALPQSGCRQNVATLRQGDAARHSDVGRPASRRCQAGLRRGPLWRGVRHSGWRRKLA